MRKTCKAAFDTYVKNGELKRKAYGKVHPDNQDYEPWTDEDIAFAWKVWQVAWVQGKMFGVEETRENLKIRKPLSEEEFRQLWIRCSIGKEFGRLVEQAHGIKGRRE